MSFSSEIRHEKIKQLQNIKNEEFDLSKFSKKEQKRSLDDSVKVGEEKKFDGRAFQFYKYTMKQKHQQIQTGNEANFFQQ